MGRADDGIGAKHAPDGSSMQPVRAACWRSIVGATRNTDYAVDYDGAVADREHGDASGRDVSSPVERERP